MRKQEFDHDYEWEIIPYIPLGRKYFTYPCGVPEQSIGLVIEFIPRNEKTWIGNFSNSGFELTQEVLATPNEDWVCINTNGAVYFVNTLIPTEYIEAPITPVIEITQSSVSGLLLLIGFTEIAVFDKDGLKWVSEVSADGIKIVEITREKIIGLAWDPPKNTYTNFEIDVKTGNVTGGSRF
jgi:hypothetical protein